MISKPDMLISRWTKAERSGSKKADHCRSWECPEQPSGRHKPARLHKAVILTQTSAMANVLEIVRRAGCRKSAFAVTAPPTEGAK